MHLESTLNLTSEKWVDVIGYDGYYQISNYGRIKSLPRVFYTAKGVECISKEKIKSVTMPKSGSTNVMCLFSVAGVNVKYTLSKQVALHFIEGYDYNQALYFIDGDRTNCRLDNLIVVTKNNVFALYDNNTVSLPNAVSGMLHKMGYKRCSVCNKIKKIDKFPKSKRNRGVNNNCQDCINKLVYSWRNNL